MTRQNGDQRSRGFELELSAEPTATWFAYASYAFTDAELTRFAEIVAARSTRTVFGWSTAPATRPPSRPGTS